MRTVEQRIVANVKWEETLLERRRWINRRVRELRAKRLALLDDIGGGQQEKARAVPVAREGMESGKDNHATTKSIIAPTKGEV